MTDERSNEGKEREWSKYLCQFAELEMSHDMGNFIIIFYFNDYFLLKDTLFYIYNSVYVD